MATCGGCGAQLGSEANFCPRCGRPAEARPAGDPLVGRTVGNYRILSVLGQGGMGRVYRAEQTNLGRPVCIKTLLTALAQDRSIVARFEREARSVSALRHPNIVGVLDFGRTPDGTLFLAMEYVDGRTLRGVIREDSPLPLERVLSIGEQILSALEEAHGAGVVHRDLKPENVLVAKLRDGSDLVKVVDFGIAKVMDPGPGTEKLTGTGMICGTPGYMPPEQILAQELDPRADLYAAGVILYELVAGRPPFGGPVQELLRAHMNETPAPPSTRTPMPVPAMLDTVVLRALEKQRERRHRSALELKRALEALRLGLRGATIAPAPAPAHKAAAQPVACPACGHPEPAGRKFCGECGAPLSAAPPSVAWAGPQAPAPAPAPDRRALDLEAARRVVPPELADHLAALPTELPGEKREVTVLCADVPGLVASAGRDAEALRALANRSLEGLVEAARRCGGTVEQVTGDGLRVVFGAPRAREDDPLRAARCALEMRAHLAETSRALPRPLVARVALHCGEALAGTIGGAGAGYAVTGEVVQIAGEVMAAAAPGEIVASRPLHRLLARAFDLRARAPVALRGRREPLEAWALAGLRAEEAAAAETLFGRPAEVAALEQLLDAAKAGRGAGLLLLGEAGLGKTRLCEEAACLAQARGMRVARARAGRLGAAAPLDVLREAIFSLCGGAPKDAAEADARLQSLVATGVDEADVRRLQHLFGTAPAAAGFEADESRRLDAAALAAPFVAAARGGLALVVDDAHLADAASLEHVGALAARAGSLRLALVAAARPGDSGKLLPGAARAVLEPLTPRDVLAIARAQLGASALDPQVESVILQRAEGNPLYTCEIVRNLVDLGAIQLAAGTWHAMPTLATVSLPESLALLLAARIDTLGDGARRLLRMAAVAGRVFSADMVVAALEAGVDAAAALGECVHRGFIEPLAQPPGCYQFRQATVHEAVLRGIVQLDLRHAHLRLAEVLERGLSFGGENPAESMARHFLAAEQGRKAVRYLVASGDRLAERNSPDAAAQRYAQALQLSVREATKAGRVDDAVAEHLLGLAAKACAARALASPDQAVALVDPVLAQVPADKAPVARADALRERASALLKLSRVNEAEASLEQALKCLAGRTAPEKLAGLCADMAAVRELRGDLAGATAQLMEGFRAIAGGATGDRDLMWKYLNQLGRIHLRARQPLRAKGFFDSARGHAKRAGSLVGEAKAATNLAGAYALAGDAANADALFEEALDLATRAGDRIGVARVHFNAGRHLVGTGRRDEGLRRLALARDLSQDIGWREGLAAASQALDAANARPAGTRAR